MSHILDSTEVIIIDRENISYEIANATLSYVVSENKTVLELRITRKEG